MRYARAVTVAAIVFLSLPGSVFAGDYSGAQEYRENCARCHGVDAKGNGPDANEKPGYRPANLTEIAKRHGGKFPRQRVYEVIDGGKRVPGHYNFDSPMPLWGLSFQMEGSQYTEESEAVVRRRINALVDYLESIQER
jgi:mono/diheme cytochrome c family protein